LNLQGPDWDARRVYQIRNAKVHAHNDGAILHVTGGEVFLDAGPINVLHAAQICVEHWQAWKIIEPQDGEPSEYGMILEDPCGQDDCPTRWFYNLVDPPPVDQTGWKI